MRQVLHLNPSVHRLPSRYRPRLLAGLFMLATPLLATALEIGAPRGTPVIGESLRLELPVGLAAGDKLPASECFTLVRRPDDADGDFFPDNMRFALERRGANALALVVRSSQSVTKPIVGFRVRVGCDAGVSRDFMFFASEREIVAPARRNALLAEAAATKTASTPISRAPLSAGMTELTITRNTRLNWLARGLYPNSRPTRDEYRRLMKAANPELFAHGGDRVGSIHIPAGTVLRIPANLPKKELPAKPKVAEPPAAPVTTPSASASRGASGQIEPAAEAPPRTTPPTDRLVIGSSSNSGRSPLPTLGKQDLRQTLDRLEQMMTEKSASDSAMSETLTSLASSFGEVKTYLQGVDERVKRAEGEQRQAQTEIQGLREELHSSFSLIELLLAVVGGSVVSALLIAFFLRRRQPLVVQGSGFPLPIPPISTTPPAPTKSSTSASAPHTATAPAASAKVTATTRGAAATAVAAASKTLSVSASPAERKPRVEPAGDSIVASGAPLPGQFSTLKKADDPSSFGTSPEHDNPFNAPGKMATVAAGLATDAAAPTVPEISPLATPSVSATTSRDPLEFTGAGESAEPHKTFGSPPPPATEPARSGDDAELELPRSFVDPVLELADVMASLGLHDEAATAVIEHIRQHPDQDPSHWFKVLEIYRSTGNRTAFDAAAQELRQKLNIDVDDWNTEPGKAEKNSLEDFPHIAQNLQALWPRPECEEFLTKLLEDNRDGKRQGFPRYVAEEIVLLRAMLRNSLQIEFPPIDNAQVGSAAQIQSASPAAVVQGNDAAIELALVDPAEGGMSRENRPLP